MCAFLGRDMHAALGCVICGSLDCVLCAFQALARRFSARLLLALTLLAHRDGSISIRLMPWLLALATGYSA